MTRAALLLCALTLVGCDDDTTPTSSTADMATPDLAGSTCPSTCGSTCPSGTTCVTMNGGPTPFGSTCLASCQTTSDCTGGRDCVNFQGLVRYCITRMEPQACGTTFCELTPPTSYCSGSDLVTNYQSVVCGLKYTHCANGCTEGAPDGGLNHEAHCL